MNIRTLVDRISMRCEELGLSETEVARAAGSKDLIRNWRRAAKEGKNSSPQMKNVELVAGMLETSVSFLTGASDDPDAPGFAEPSVEPFRFSEPVLGDMLTRYVAPEARTSDTYRARESFPGFAISRGDLIVTELSGDRIHGDLVVVNMRRGDVATVTLRRLVGEWLAPHDPTQPLESADPDDQSVGILGTVRGLVRRSERPA